MRTVNSTHIEAGLDDVFRLAAEIERWPDLLPHYRWVHTLWRLDSTALVQMAAKRSWIPVKWTSVQHCSRDERRIYYKHVDGPTAGMWVEWSFTPTDRGIQVMILHDLTLSRPIVGSFFGKWIVGRFFVEPIADLTLERMKALAEDIADAGTA